MTSSASAGKRNILTNATANWIGYASQVLTALFVSPLLVHALGLDRYGIWSLVESILAYLVLLDLGVGASVVRYVARFEATDDHEQVNRVFSTSVCVFAVAGLTAFVLAAAVAYLGLPLFNIQPSELQNEARWLLILLGLNLALGLPLKVFACILDGLGRYPTQTAIRSAWLFIRTGVLLAVALRGGGLVPLGLVISACNLLEHVSLGVAAKYFLPELRFSLTLADRSTLRTIRGYTVHAFVAMIAGRISFQTASMVIGAFLLPAQITLFWVAARLVEYAKDSFRVVTAGIMPAVSVLEARGDDKGIRNVFVQGTRYMLWLVLPVQVGLMCLGKCFLALWMKREPSIAEGSYPTLLILAAPFALALPQVVAARILYGLGRLRWFSRAALVEALANLVLSIVLVQSIGIEGVALGTAIPNIIGSSALIVYICRTLDVGVFRYLRSTFVAPLLAALPLCIAWLVAARWVGVTSWLALVTVGVTGLTAYLLVGALTEFGPRRVLGFLRSVTSNFFSGRDVYNRRIKEIEVSP
jgi:O-antigen/teichoic acid export membrane protein